MLTVTKSQKFFRQFSLKNICVKEGISSINTNLLYSINGHPILQIREYITNFAEKGENKKTLFKNNIHIFHSGIIILFLKQFVKMKEEINMACVQIKGTRQEVVEMLQLFDLMDTKGFVNSIIM